MSTLSDQLYDVQASPTKVMIVDDDQSSRLLLSALIAKTYDVATCSSGEEALATFDSFNPDLILMDVEMPGLNGYETCRQIRLKDTELPIIFVTAHQSIEEHLKAYDAGGDDITTKPVDSKILLHKVKLALRQKSDKDHLAQESKSLHEMAMNFLSNIGESGILLEFVRKAVVAKSYKELAQQLIESASEFGVQCCVMLRHQDGQIIETSKGEASQLEKSILEKMSGMGRLFQFKRQFIVNYDKVSIIITADAQDSPEKIGRIRDNAAILAEIAEALCESVSVRMGSTVRTEQMQIALLAASVSLDQSYSRNKNLLVDSRILLQELVDNIDSAFSRLNLIPSHESTISKIITGSIEKLLALHSDLSQSSEEASSINATVEPSNAQSNNPICNHQSCQLLITGNSGLSECLMESARTQWNNPKAECYCEDISANKLVELINSKLKNSTMNSSLS